MKSSRAEMRSLEERFHALFVGNVAGAILTTPEGKIVDCNDAFVRMFGFDSRISVLAGTAWDFYFDRASRDALISPSRVVENYSGEEIVLRHKSGAPIYVMNTRMVASRTDNRPALVLGTAIDMTEQKRLEKRVRELSKSILSLPDLPPRDEPHDLRSFSVEPELATELAILLGRINQSLQPDKLGLVGKSEAHDFVVIVERMKVLVQKLEILRLTTELKREN